MLAAIGVPSPYLGDNVDPQFTVDSMLAGQGALLDSAIPQVAPGQTARQLLADVMKETLRSRAGIDTAGLSDAELLDAIEYFVFPNLVPWGGHVFPVVYRFRPWGNDPHSSLMEIMVMVGMPDGVALPPDTPLRMISPDALFGDQPELGSFGAVLDQDRKNLGMMQRGLRSDSCTHVTLANYQERNIRNFHIHLASMVQL
jgi:hypothetical protein